MKLTTKLGKAFKHGTYFGDSGVRRWKEIRALIHDLPTSLGDAVELRFNSESRQAYEQRLHKLNLSNLLQSIDLQELARIKAQYGDGHQSIWAKYLEIEKWLQRNADYVKDLGLVRHPPKSVLDLGCGAGFFLFVLKQLGSEVLGVDLDHDPIFTAMVNLFGLERVGYSITRQTKMPDFNGRTFDLITAWMICFNNFNHPDTVWKANDWNYFLDDLNSRLTDDGQVFLSFNKQYDRKLYDDDVQQLLLARSKVIRGKLVILTKRTLNR